MRLLALLVILFIFLISIAIIEYCYGMLSAMVTLFDKTLGITSPRPYDPRPHAVMIVSIVLISLALIIIVHIATAIKSRRPVSETGGVVVIE